MRPVPGVARPLLVLVLALAGCSPRTPDDRPPAPLPAPPPPPADTRATRAEAAGLSERQAADLDSLGVPVYVPVLPAGWTLTEATSRLTGVTDDSVSVRPEYILRVRTSEQTCLVFVALTEGINDVFVFEDPPNERDVRVPGVPVAQPLRLGWGIAGETTEGWEDGRVMSDWFGTDGLSLQIRSSDADGCAPASPEAAETFLEALRPLDPADDAVLLGPVARVEVEPATAFGADPEALALAAFSPADLGEGRQRVGVETLRRRARFAVVLVTTTGLPDDSVRDERTRVVLGRVAEGWTVTAAGRQVRCQQGRGHADWSAEACT